jgi:hypothetical protein
MPSTLDITVKKNIYIAYYLNIAIVTVTNLLQYTVTRAIKYQRMYLCSNCEQELYTLHMNLTVVSV